MVTGGFWRENFQNHFALLGCGSVGDWIGKDEEWKFKEQNK